MDRILWIKYGRGRMAISVDTFFPTSRTRIRKLVKIMRLDCDHDLGPELVTMMEDRLQSVKEEWRDLYTTIDEKKIRWEQSAAVLQHRQKLVNDLRKRKEKALLEDAMAARKQAEEVERELRLEYRTAKNRIRKLETLHKALRLNVEIVKEETGK